MTVTDSLREAAWAPRVAAAAPWVAVAALAAWSASPSGWLLALAGVTATVWVILSHPHRVAAAAAAVLLGSTALGFFAHREIGFVADRWDEYWEERVSEIEVDLNEELDRRQASGELATDALAALWESGVTITLEDVAALRTESRSAALALYDPTGRLVVWDGVHRGKVPEDGQSGARRHSYHDQPLFGYLYVSSVATDGSVAVAAYLLRAALPEALGADAEDLAARFFEETGERIRITADEPGVADVVWDLALDDRILSVVLERPESSERTEAVRDRWRVRLAWLVVLGWLLLVAGTARGTGGGIAAGLTLAPLAIWLPFELMGLPPELFDVTRYALPGPVPLPVGRVALCLGVGYALLSLLGSPKARLHPLVAGAVAGALLPVVSAWLAGGGVGASLAVGTVGWVGYEVALAGTFGLIAGVALLVTGSGVGSTVGWVGALLTSLALALGVAGWIVATSAAPAWVLVLWGVPIALAGWAIRTEDELGRLLRWTVALVVAATAALPTAWEDRLQARVAHATDRLERLAQADQPELEEALLRFGYLADSLDAAGAVDVAVMYEGWRRSGLAELGNPVWLQIHARDGSPREGLRVGVAGGEPEPLGEILASGWALGGIQLHQPNQLEARYVLTALLGDGDLASVVAPAVATGAGRSTMGPLLLSGADGGEVDALSVLPVAPGGPRPGSAPELTQARGGWQLSLGLDFDNARPYRATVPIDLPTGPLALARASLILALDLLLFLAFCLGGWALVRESPRVGMQDVEGGWGLRGRVISFRARVTLALFGFFALANALFGTVAYQTLEQASRRSAQVIAERIVEDASGWYRTFSGEVDRLATQVGAELLEYRDGELFEGSVSELVELGLYEAWVPYEQYRLIEEMVVEQNFTEASVGRSEYVTAYRRLPDGDVLAAQLPLQAGSSALQTSDLLELLAFVVLLGAALSLGLAMLAGRALTRPIRALLVASESVGAGDLALHLPEERSDEFGAVFRAFNRMVARVRTARQDLVRTSLRTQLIMDEAAVGMVALDEHGGVTLVNPRVESLLGVPVAIGEPIPRAGELGEELTVWLDGFLESGADEATTDVQVVEQRVRVRARRLDGFETGRGAVVALDDVTDELRAERVLAWGEMARQVAHEVKNPLTPIKLSIQHVRRAWDDGRPDFQDILIRNADAMLLEIDRLAGIAQSFSRFGAPGQGSVPLEGVPLHRTVGEVMTLYDNPGGGVRFEADVPEELPPVVARPAELKEVLVNLLENARLAGADGTRVVVAARNGDDSVVLSVTDDGDGIPEESLPRVFEPQFSTRSTGTGLGLAIVQRLVQAWGGSVSVESRVGEGTTVSIALRIWPERVGAPE